MSSWWWERNENSPSVDYPSRWRFFWLSSSRSSFPRCASRAGRGSTWCRFYFVMARWPCPSGRRCSLSDVTTGSQRMTNQRPCQMNVTAAALKSRADWSISSSCFSAFCSRVFSPLSLRGRWWLHCCSARWAQAFYLALQFHDYVLHLAGRLFRNETVAWLIFAPGLFAALLSPLVHLTVTSLRPTCTGTFARSRLQDRAADEARSDPLPYLFPRGRHPFGDLGRSSSVFGRCRSRGQNTLRQVFRKGSPNDGSNPGRSRRHPGPERHSPCPESRELRR